MTPNSENAMARFLLAILNQKNLKDIDWNQVAADPVLMQPITNGHAARMRFARFKSSVLGTEPQRRNKTGDKSRVSKSKKAPAPKRDSLVKSESGVSLSSYAQVRRQSSPGVKQEETGQPAHLAQFSPVSNTSPYLTDAGRDDFSLTHRFLTPCSDDMASGLSVNPASLEDTRLRNGFGPSMDNASEYLHQAAAHGGYAQSPPLFANYDAEYDLGAHYRATGETHDALGLTGAQSLADGGNEWATGHFDEHTF